ncbi:N-6 DNA methylase, partial [Salmonella enterica]|nr:N-6 DNA methylase [Salmonella enterica]EJU1974012.1 N-6 DNA methylase [Salmonella enterica]
QPGWPLPPRPQPSLNVVRDLLRNSGVPVIHRDNVLPVYRALHDRIELPPAASYTGEEAYWQDILNLLVRATGHPQRLHRFGLAVDGRTDEVQEALVAELGAAFLTASLGLPGRQTSRHDVAPRVSFLHDDPWRLFRAAEAARKAMVWLRARRPAMTTVEMWQKMASLILETHYGFPLDDTTLGCRSVVERHLECGITPLMAINALARIYQWERCDQPQRSLFLNDVGADSEILTLSEMRPGLLTCYRVPATSGEPAGEMNTGAPGSLPLLPPLDVSEGEGAANDDGPDDPDGNDNVVALPWAARRGKTSPHVQRFVSLFNQTAPYENRWQVFSDFVHMAACSLYNAVHRDEAFEADYMQRVARYSVEDAHNMSRLLAEVIQGLEFCPSDFLGQIFMNLELGNTRHGQYFTPYNVCYTMSRMTLSDGLSVLTSGERDFITVSDPACGAGGMIVAMAEAMLEAGFNPQKQMVAYCVDIDPVAAMMCYIQLSLMGIPAIVATGNSLTVDIKREMATPMFVLGHWHHRWQAGRSRQAA